MNILGISALYHDSAASLVRDGEIIAAAQEERFTRKKADARIPKHSIRYCLQEGQLKPDELDLVVFYEKPITKLTRLLSTSTEIAPAGLKTFLMAVPVWLKEKAWVGYHIQRFLRQLGYRAPRGFEFAEHHHAHAASAFYPSPFQEAAIITVDGVGEWSTTTVGLGEGNSVRILFEQRFPHSLGMLYSAFTYFTGFKVNSGEYKLMGLAPYGEPAYVDQIKKHLIQIREDGSFRINLTYFGFLDELKMTNDRFAKLFGGPPREPEGPITRREMDLARSIQEVTEEVMLKMARYARSVTGKRHLCMAGGVALNCVANGHIHRSGLFDDLWIQPAAGDAGGALGAALYSWFHIRRHERLADGQHDCMKGAQLGPYFTQGEIKKYLDANQIPYRDISPDEWACTVATMVAQEKVVGLFYGRMEFGPRALCNRSIVADARSTKMQSYLNLATKFRESFRPFAPVVLKERALDYFTTTADSPYMLLVDQVCAERCQPCHANRDVFDLKDWVNEVRSDIPAITHVDYSARIQTIDRERSPHMHAVLHEFERLTGYAVMVNTSFNVRNEPIVCTPEDAYVCFMRTGMDVLFLENLMIEKTEQPTWQEEIDWKKQFVLD
jgi:carbamoyltransferase